MEKRIAVFAGSFDPFTIGHENIARRGLKIFDEIIIAVGQNTSKVNMFSLEQRVEWIKAVFADEPRISVDLFQGLTVNYCVSKKANFILRGARTTIDFEFERAIGQMNYALNNTIETVVILPLPEHSAISSTIVRDIVKHGGDAGAFVPNAVNLNAFKK